MRGWGALKTVGLAAVAGALLTSCIKLDVDMTVQSDDTIDGTFTVGVSKQLMAFLPGGAGGLGDLFDQGGEPDFGGADAKVTPFEDDKFIGQTVTFSGVPLEQASSGIGGDGSGDLTIDKEGDTYHLQGTLDLTQADAGIPSDVPLPNLDELFDDAEIRIKVTFPGPITETNGTADGCSVSWDPAFGQEVDLDAVARTSGDCGDGIQWWGWLLIGLAGAVLVGAIIAIVLSIRYERRRHRKLITPTASEPPVPGAVAGTGAAVGGFPPPNAGSAVDAPDGPPTEPPAPDAVPEPPAPPPPPAAAVPPPPAPPDAPADPPADLPDLAAPPAPDEPPGEV